MSKILVIEDAEPLRSDIMEMLTFEGFEVKGAENGIVGIDVAREYVPDLIVCDIMMPELDGYDVLESLRQDGSTAAIPFIFLTAKTDRSDMRHGMGLGADDYLTKPFEAQELLGTIRARLQRHETFVEIAEQQVQKNIQELSENIITALPHELRTPLNTILGFSEMMSSEAKNLKPDEIVKWSQHIHDAGERLNHLMENYLMYARIETLHRDSQKAEELRQFTATPNPLILVVAEQIAARHNRRDDLTIDVADDNTMIPITDQDLTRIVEEIMDNAFKFSQEGNKVTLSASVQHGKYTIVVTDQGNGMTQEQIDSVGAYRQFDRFFYEQQGTGLGLIASKRLTELYLGKLTLQSAPKESTTVTIELPITD